MWNASFDLDPDEFIVISDANFIRLPFDQKMKKRWHRFTFGFQLSKLRPGSFLVTLKSHFTDTITVSIVRHLQRAFPIFVLC